MRWSELKTWMRDYWLSWRTGYLAAWVLLGVTAGLARGLEEEPAFYGLEIQADVSEAPCDPPTSATAGCLRVGGIATLAGQPWAVDAVTLHAFGEWGTPLKLVNVAVEKTGAFAGPAIPREIGKEKLARIELSATQPLARLRGTQAEWIATAADHACASRRLLDDSRCHLIRGAETLTIQGANAVRHERTFVPLWAILLGAGTFLCGITASVVGAKRLGMLAHSGASLAIALCSLLMLGVIAAGYLYVLENHHDGGTVIQTSLGYLTRGTYHADIPEDWIFSLTLPASNPTGSLIGFGAPLWAILLATFGACLIAVQYLVRSPFELEPAATNAAPAPTGAAPAPTKDSKTKEEKDVWLTGNKADQLLSILFAPLGSLFVYQALMALETTRFVTIAAVILASGLTVNLLVAQASSRVNAIVLQAVGPTPTPKAIAPTPNDTSNPSILGDTSSQAPPPKPPATPTGDPSNQAPPPTPPITPLAPASK